MIKFQVISTGEIKEAYSAKEENDKICIKFSSNGKEYTYNKQNVRLIESNVQSNSNLPFILYTYESKCWKCKNPIDIMTYIRYDDGNREDVTYPYDMNRLFEHQMIEYHMFDASCEYFSISVIGEIPKFDELLVNKFPNNISYRFSNKIGREYAMNICPVSKSHVGKNFVYKDVNKFLQSKIELQEVKE